jgi:hypothetical protein
MSCRPHSPPPKGFQTLETSAMAGSVIGSNLNSNTLEYTRSRERSPGPKGFERESRFYARSATGNDRSGTGIEISGESPPSPKPRGFAPPVYDSSTTRTPSTQPFELQPSSTPITSPGPSSISLYTSRSSLGGAKKRKALLLQSDEQDSLYEVRPRKMGLNM